MKEPVTVTLSEPVKLGSQTIAELVVQPPKAKHIRKLPVDVEGFDMGTMLDLASRLTGQPDTVIDELDAQDALRLAEAVGKFLEGEAREPGG